MRQMSRVCLESASTAISTLAGVGLDAPDLHTPPLPCPRCGPHATVEVPPPHLYKKKILYRVGQEVVEVGGGEVGGGPGRVSDGGGTSGEGVRGGLGQNRASRRSRARVEGGVDSESRPSREIYLVSRYGTRNRLVMPAESARPCPHSARVGQAAGGAPCGRAGYVVGRGARVAQRDAARKRKRSRAGSAPSFSTLGKAQRERAGLLPPSFRWWLAT